MRYINNNSLIGDTKKLMKIVGILMFITGCSLIGWTLIQAYKNYKNEKSILMKLILIIMTLFEFSLEFSGIIIILAYILILFGIVFIFYYPI